MVPIKLVATFPRVPVLQVMLSLNRKGKGDYLTVPRTGAAASAATPEDAEECVKDALEGVIPLTSS